MITSPGLQAVHHIAIICSDYQKSKGFYSDILGLKIIQEVYREDRNSWKCDLAIGDQYIIELFSFPSPPSRPTRPEACGLRHLAFKVRNIREVKTFLESNGIAVEEIRTDQYTGKLFTFFSDPDGLPLELYEVS